MEQEKTVSKKKWLVLGIVAAVVVLAVIGFNIWHSQPSFCNAICHSPMDTYVESYESGNPNLLITNHHQAGLNCLNCHESNPVQQVSEAMSWAIGDFDDPIKSNRLGTRDFCFRCHNDGNSSDGMDWDAIVASTANYSGSARNPHDSHQGDLECYTCHSMHGKSKLYCRQCHSDVTSPSGWN